MRLWFVLFIWYSEGIITDKEINLTSLAFSPWASCVFWTVYEHIYGNIPPAGIEPDLCCALHARSLHRWLSESSFQMPLLWFQRRTVLVNSPMSKCSVWFRRFSSEGGWGCLRLEGESCSVRTRVLSYTMYDMLTKCGGAGNLHFLRCRTEGAGAWQRCQHSVEI